MEESLRARTVLWYDRPAGEWIEGLPIGNGTLGGMVLGKPLAERVGLNHDRLWRRYWTYHPKGIAADMAVVQELCRAERWGEAFTHLDRQVIGTGKGLYVNPYVPLGDLGYFPVHDGEVNDYIRELDLGTGIVEVSYRIGGVCFTRRYFASAPHQVLVMHLSASRAGSISGEVTLSRLLDPDCIVVGTSSLSEVTMQGHLEEDIRFAAVARVVQRGGRLTGGRRDYAPPAGEMLPCDLNGCTFAPRRVVDGAEPCGVSTCIDSADEALILVAMGTSLDPELDPVFWCRNHLSQVPLDLETLHREHIICHQSLYKRVRLRLGGEGNVVPTSDAVRLAGETHQASPLLIEQLFNFGRYLAVSASRKGTAPINLQGIWNQDRRPAWDSDYHLDMNVQMCYWALEMANLGDLSEPLFDWVERLLPQARIAAADLYGCRGIYFPAVNDLHGIGNVDNLCLWWTGAAAWLGQHFWMHWGYTRDVQFLRDRAYPFLREVGQFYEDFLSEDVEGRLIPCPSMSPEVAPKGYDGFLSPPSTMDLELIRETFEHLLDAAKILNVAQGDRANWERILDALPYPVISADGRLQEWLDDLEPADAGHRHLSHLIGLCPGERITAEGTPTYFAAAAEAIEAREEHPESGCAWGSVWRAQVYARLYQGEEAWRCLMEYCQSYLTSSLLSSIVDWRDRGRGLRWFGGAKVFQIDACLGVIGVIAEMILQDRGGLLRLLPALPSALADGEVRGLRARGGFEVAMAWSSGRLTWAEIVSLGGRMCRVKVFGGHEQYVVTTGGDECEVRIDSQAAMVFSTEAGMSYRVVPGRGNAEE